MMDYSDYDGVGLAELVRKGEVSARELAIEASVRLDEADAALGCVAHRLDLDQSVAGHARSGVFRGVPFLFKDQLDIADLPMTLGSRLLKGHRSDFTHPIAQRMLDTGFVPLGRTTMSELGLLPTTESAAYGATRNPWGRDHSVGGSSGGSAAAVASGAVPIAHASDGGGSIRIPAACCGLVGLKPSAGRLPVDPSDPPLGFVTEFGVTRTVRDAAALLDAVGAEQRIGHRYLPTPEHGYVSVAARPPRPLRVGLTSYGFYGETLHPEVAEALERAASALETAGHIVELVPIPIDVGAFAHALRVLWSTAPGVLFSSALEQTPLPRWIRRALDRSGLFATIAAAAGLVEPFTYRLARVNARYTPKDFWFATQTFAEAARRLEVFFETYDLWMTSTLTSPPPRLGAVRPRGSDARVERDLMGLIGFTPIANATGVPAISVPAGLSRDGLPIGVHFTGPMGREDLLLAVAAELERVQPWPKLAPVREPVSPLTVAWFGAA